MCCVLCAAVDGKTWFSDSIAFLLWGKRLFIHELFGRKLRNLWLVIQVYVSIYITGDPYATRLVHPGVDEQGNR